MLVVWYPARKRTEIFGTAASVPPLRRVEMKSVLKKMLVFTAVIVLASCGSLPGTLDSISSGSGIDTGSSSNTGGISVRYDGVYFVPYGGMASMYLRFYADGIVIDVTAMAKPNEIKSWFNKNSENVGNGLYTIENDKINFTVNTDKVIVEYTGEIIKDGLILDSRSNNGNERKNIRYVFYKW
jgi:hypothetical protein